MGFLSELVELGGVLPTREELARKNTGSLQWRGNLGFVRTLFALATSNSPRNEHVELQDRRFSTFARRYRKKHGDDLAAGLGASGRGCPRRHASVRNNTLAADQAGVTIRAAGHDLRALYDRAVFTDVTLRSEHFPPAVRFSVTGRSSSAPSSSPWRRVRRFTV